MVDTDINQNWLKKKNTVVFALGGLCHGVEEGKGRRCPF